MLEPDYFDKKRQELGMGRYDQLQQVQVWLEERYPGQARAISFNKSVLVIMTASASVAADLRLKQTKLLTDHAALEIARLSIRIGTR